jgi:hypothetical protein
VEVVEPPDTVWTSGGETLVRTPGDPEYTAVMVCLPGVRAVVVRVALPLLSRGAVPRTVEPSWNVTVPVGVPAPLDVTVVLRTTGWPGADWLDDEVSEVVLELVGTLQVSGGLVM